MNTIHPIDAPVKTGMSSNGSDNGHMAALLAEEALDVQASAPHPRQATTISDELDTFIGDASALQQFSLDSADRLAKLSRKDFAVFCTHLKERGVSSEWIRTELKPVVNDEKRDEGTGPTWTHYVEAAQGLGYSFRLNELDDKLEVNGERATDVIEAEMLSHLHAKGLRNADVARRAFMTAAAQNRFHPVKAYLQRSHWDGQDHILHLAQYFADSHPPILYPDGTSRTAFHAFQRRWFIGAVAKTHEPKNAQNAMLILDGDQGKGKSHYAKWLCSALPDLHYEGAIKPDDKDYLCYLTTRFIWEVGELGATMRGADREALKAFVTLQEATYRPSYGRYPLHKPALASFIGTVNLEGGLLNDPTGHRRFWPVNVTRLDWNYSSNIDINQVWAQAYALYLAGEPWRLSDEERQAHQQITAMYEIEDIMEGYIRQWFDVRPGDEGLYTHTTNLLDVIKNPNKANAKGTDTALQMKLSTTLKKMGLDKQKRNNQWGYVGIRQKSD